MSAGTQPKFLAFAGHASSPSIGGIGSLVIHADRDRRFFIRRHGYSAAPAKDLHAALRLLQNRKYRHRMICG